MIRQYPAPHDPYDGSVEESPLVKLWYGVLTDCLNRGCERIQIVLSDPPDLPESSELVFLEDEEPSDSRTFTIRAYANGAWEEIMKPTAKMYGAFLQRLKVMASFSLARRPPTEQGRFRFAMRDSVYEICVTVRVRADGSQDAMIDLPSGPLETAEQR